MSSDQQLATFRIDATEWDEFKALCKRETSNASAELIRFVRSCLKADALPKTDDFSLPQGHLENILDSRLDSKLEPLLDEVDALRSRVDEMDDRLGKYAA